MKPFRRTSRAEAHQIIANASRATGTYLTEGEWTGVWVSDRPLGCNDGVPLRATVLLEIELQLPEAAIADLRVGGGRQTLPGMAVTG